jgi:hypothetical protein
MDVAMLATSEVTSDATLAGLEVTSVATDVSTLRAADATEVARLWASDAIEVAADMISERTWAEARGAARAAKRKRKVRIMRIGDVDGRKKEIAAE